MEVNTQCLFSPSASTDKWMGEKTAVTLQLFLVCLCICECWICKTVCLESSHFFLVRLTRCIPQNPVGISGARRRDLGPSSKQISERCFCLAQCRSHW